MMLVEYSLLMLGEEYDVLLPGMVLLIRSA
jgi:hypothetical protein